MQTSLPDTLTRIDDVSELRPRNRPSKAVRRRRTIVVASVVAAVVIIAVVAAVVLLSRVINYWSIVGFGAILYVFSRKK